MSSWVLIMAWALGMVWGLDDLVGESFLKATNTRNIHHTKEDSEGRGVGRDEKGNGWRWNIYEHWV